MITAEQKAFFHTFGFLMLGQMFSISEMKQLRVYTIDVIRRMAGDDAFSSDEGYHLMPFMERHAQLTALVDDDRIHDIPETLLGPDFILNCTDAHIRRGDTLWHGRDPSKEAPDAASLDGARVCIYFDPLDKQNGCLRVIPGSHRRPFADFLAPLRCQYDNPSDKAFGLAADEIPSVALQTEPGDVLVFTESVYHGSFGSQTGRLQITAQFLANPTTAAQIRELKKASEQYNWSLHPAESFIYSDRPRVRRMVARLVELGCTPLPV